MEDKYSRRDIDNNSWSFWTLIFFTNFKIKHNSNPNSSYTGFLIPKGMIQNYLRLVIGEISSLLLCLFHSLRSVSRTYVCLLFGLAFIISFLLPSSPSIVGLKLKPLYVSSSVMISKRCAIAGWNGGSPLISELWILWFESRINGGGNFGGSYEQGQLMEFLTKTEQF